MPSKILTITVGDGRTATELLEAGGYDRVDAFTRDLAASPDLTTDVEPREVVLEVLEFPAATTTSEVLSEMERRGLQRPEPGDALRVGAAYPEEQRHRPLVFLHAPRKTSTSDEERILMLNRKDRPKPESSIRRIYGFTYDRAWEPSCRFPARRPS